MFDISYVRWGWGGQGAGKSREGKSSAGLHGKGRDEGGKTRVEALGVPGEEGGEVRGVGVWK
jgi:hypothetical protein